MPTDPVFKRCPCGAALTRSDWLALPVCGDQRFPGGPAIELRNHSCGSTIAVEVPSPDLSSLVRFVAHLSANLVERFGALRLARHELDDEVICATVTELRERGRDGLASAVASLRYAADDAPVAASRRAS